MKIGDKVKIVSAPPSGAGAVGKEAVIEDIDTICEADAMPYKVRTTTGSTYHCNAENLRSITPHVPLSPIDALRQELAHTQIQANYWYNKDVDLFAAYQALIEQLKIKIDDTQATG